MFMQKVSTVSLWTPPNLEQRTVTRPAYSLQGQSEGFPLEGERLRVILTTLEQIVAARVRVNHPQAAPAEINAASQQARMTWLMHVNDTWENSPSLLNLETLDDPDLACSVEFYYLAEFYARAISDANTFAEYHGKALLESICQPWMRILPSRVVFPRLARELSTRSEISLRAIGVGWRAATVQWQAKSELTQLPPSYWEDYLRSSADTYKALFRALPYELTASRRATVVENLSMLEEAPYFQWDYTWEDGSGMIGPLTVIGLLISVGLGLLVVLGGQTWLAWLALLPTVLAAVWGYHRRLSRGLAVRESELAEKITQSEVQAAEVEAVSHALHIANEALQHQVETLTSIRNATLSMSTLLDQGALLEKVIELVTNQLRFDRALILITRPGYRALTFGAISHPAPTSESQFRLEQLEILLEPDFTLVGHWLEGRSVLLENAETLYNTRFGWIFSVLGIQSLYSVPLLLGNELTGVIIVDNKFTKQPFSEESKGLLEALGANISIALQNSRLYQRTDDQLNKHVQELDMMRQVDRELMEALNWDRVLNMILDWGLRVTGAHSASLAMVDPEARELRIVAGYGLDIPDDDLKNTILTYEQGVMGRVARTGSPAIIEDVRNDPDYIALTDQTVAYMSVPIRRRGRVTAILNLESPHAGAFAPNHLDFVERLSNRGSVALDNARLFEETQREREKLSRIVEKTADIIIVVGFDHRIIMLNEAAIANFRLNPRQDYAGQDFFDVFAYSPLETLGNRFLSRSGQNVHMVDEVLLESNHYYHVDVASNEQIGWLIVMHDVTPFKETERLKNELIATVSHDLKNPLSVINGYIELLAMYNELNDRGQEFMVMIRRSIRTMRQLIDDLLDLAHIDAGLDIKPKPVSLPSIINESITGLSNMADEKQLTMAVNVPEDLPLVAGDERRLRQIIVNLVSNAIKYTQPEGHVTINARPQNDSAVVISVEDDGLGISPEDQAQIFERFYRVRRPETDGIEGTGLGLAIVKSLVEAHGGEIGLTSHLGEGSTFFFTVPTMPSAAFEQELPRAS